MFHAVTALSHEENSAMPIRVTVCVLAARGDLPRLDHNPFMGDLSDWYVAYGVAAAVNKFGYVPFGTRAGFEGTAATCDVQNDRRSARWDSCCHAFDTTRDATLRFELFDSNLMAKDVLCCAAETEVRSGASTLALDGGAGRYLDVHIDLAAPPPPSPPSPPPPPPIPPPSPSPPPTSISH